MSYYISSQKKFTLIISTLYSIVLSTSVTSAATISFDNEYTGEPYPDGWLQDENWDLDRDPLANDDAILGAGFTSSVNGNSIYVGSGSILIESGATLNLNDSSIFLSSSGGVSVTIKGTLNVNNSSYLVTNANDTSTQNTFLIDGGVINVGTWNNSLRFGAGLATGSVGVGFNQAGDTINIINFNNGGAYTTYNDKFGYDFFGIEDELAIWTNTATGRESQVHNGLKLIRTDNIRPDTTFINSTITLVAVPEPSSTSLFGLTALCIMFRRLR